MTTIKDRLPNSKSSQELDLNISKICKNSLKIYITRLQGANDISSAGPVV